MDVILTSNEDDEMEWHIGHPSCEALEGCGGVFAVDPSHGTLAKVSSALNPHLSMPRKCSS